MSPHLVTPPRLVATALCCAMSVSAVPGATAGEQRSYNLPSGDAATTLNQFAEASGQQIVFMMDKVKGERTNAVAGRYDARNALDRMLAGTGLSATRDPATGAFVVSRKSQKGEVGPASDQQPKPKPMPPKSVPTKLGVALAAFASAILNAQTTPPASLPQDETVTLSPFTVNSSKDDGYTAANSLAGGRLASPLQEMASSVSVLTREFLDDIAATDLLSASQYFTNSIPGNPGGMNDYGVSLRGFPSGFLYRNFFISYVNPDTYVTERLDSARGPNALVFGDTKAGGTLNLSTKQAKFRNFGQIAYRYNSEGGFGRTTVDANYKLTDRLAVRGGALYQDENDWVDFTYIRRQGAYLTGTWNPFPKTSVRIEGESYTQRQSSPWIGSVLRDNTGSWDGTTGYTAANQAIVAGSGTSRLGSNYKVFAPGTNLGVVDWTGFGQTAGTGYQIDVNRPAYLPASTPVLPYRAYNIRLGDDSDVKLTYRTLGTYIEHQVGDHLYLEVAGNFARQLREQFQQATEGVYTDINRNLPSGAANPNFGKRYTETGQMTFTNQQNTLYEARASAAYVAKFGAWSEHRFLLGTSYRRDQYRDRSRELIVDAPGAVFQNQFINPNAVRMRVYEDQRGVDQQVPTGIKSGLWNFFPGEDKDLYSAQFAASSKWFSDGRLVTLVGIRRDQLRKYGTVANVNPVTGEFTSYLERYTGPAVAGLSGGGYLQKFNPVTTKTAGAVYKLLPWLSPYAAYSEGYDTSNVGFLLNPATGIANVPLPAKESKGHEFGLKFNLLNNRLVGSVGYYQNTQTNDSNTGVGVPRNQINALWNVVDNVATSPRQLPTSPSEIIDYKGTGVEFEVTANLTKNWRAMFNLALPETERQGGFARTIAYYNLNRAEWGRTLAALQAAGDARAGAFSNNLQAIDSTIASVANGLPLSGTVKYTANLFTNYEFSAGALKGLRLGGGANLRGTRYVGYQQRVPLDASSFQRLETKGTQLFAFTAGYRINLFNRPVNFQLNVENVFDEPFKRYFSFNTITTPSGSVVFNGNSYGLQAPRRFILSTDVRF
jgi:iron complex outermembrane recepter protein